MSFPLLHYSSQSDHRHSPDSQGGDTGSTSGRRGTHGPHREGGVDCLGPLWDTEYHGQIFIPESMLWQHGGDG